MFCFEMNAGVFRCGLRSLKAWIIGFFISYGKYGAPGGVFVTTVKYFSSGSDDHLTDMIVGCFALFFFRCECHS